MREANMGAVYNRALLARRAYLPDNELAGLSEAKLGWPFCTGVALDCHPIESLFAGAVVVCRQLERYYQSPASENQAMMQTGVKPRNRHPKSSSVRLPVLPPRCDHDTVESGLVVWHCCSLAHSPGGDGLR